MWKVLGYIFIIILMIIVGVIEKVARVIQLIKEANEVRKAPVGHCPGDRCNRGACTGYIHQYGGVCTCHTGNPPCQYCVEGEVCCDTCDYDSQEHGEGLDYDQDYEDGNFYSIPDDTDFKFDN